MANFLSLNLQLLSLLAILYGLILLDTAFAAGASLSCTNTPCSITPTCPPNYVYSSCYDSCYYFAANPLDYTTALRQCVVDGAHFFVPNSLGELNSIMTNGSDKTKRYWLGLQDWARRGSGTNTTGWTIADITPSDPDGKWTWMDNKGSVVGPNYTAASNYYYDSSVSWLHWLNPPNSSVDFVASLVYLNSSWMAVSGDSFSDTANFICEYSSTCMTCPAANFTTKYLNYCYSFSTTPVKFTSAKSECNSIYSGTSIWSPKSEAQIIFARMMTNSLNSSLWLGLDRSSAATPWKWESNGQSVSASDALDVLTGEPLTSNTAFKIIPDSTFYPDAVRDGWNGWRTDDRTHSYNGEVCQIGAIYLYGSPVVTTSTTTTKSSTTVVTTTASAIINATSTSFHQSSIGISFGVETTTLSSATISYSIMPMSSSSLTAIDDSSTTTAVNPADITTEIVSNFATSPATDIEHTTTIKDANETDTTTVMNVIVTNTEISASTTISSASQPEMMTESSAADFTTNPATVIEYSTTNNNVTEMTSTTTVMSVIVTTEVLASTKLSSVSQPDFTTEIGSNSTTTIKDATEMDNSTSTTISTSTQLGLYCGNGILEISLSESCDDGNANNGDGCSSNCTLEFVNRTLDIYLAIDTSFNVPLLQFAKIKMFAKSLINQLILKSSGGTVQLGIVIFGGRTVGYRLLPLKKSSQYSTAQIANFLVSAIYFGNTGNLSNALSRLLDPTIFSSSDGSRWPNATSMVIVVTASSAPDMQVLEDQLSLLSRRHRKLHVVGVGEKIKKKQMARVAAWGGSYDHVKHADQLATKPIHRTINFLLNA